MRLRRNWVFASAIVVWAWVMMWLLGFVWCMHMGLRHLSLDVFGGVLPFFVLFWVAILYIFRGVLKGMLSKVTYEECRQQSKGEEMAKKQMVCIIKQFSGGQCVGEWKAHEQYNHWVDNGLVCFRDKATGAEISLSGTVRISVQELDVVDEIVDVR